MKELTKEHFQDIEKSNNQINWRKLIYKYEISETFLEANIEKIDWRSVSQYKKLSESFIEKHASEIDWNYISQYQKLSEEFIENNADKVNWLYISIFQILSEEFIEKYSNKVNWLYIPKHQKLSESFIEKHQTKVYWPYVSKYQKLSPEFIKKHNLKIRDTCWLYKDKEFKRKYIQENTNHEIIGDKVIAYKPCRIDGHSAYNLHYKYEVGREYESHANHNIGSHDQHFGLFAFTENKARNLFRPYGKILKVEIDLDNVSAILNYKIIASKIKILEELN